MLHASASIIEEFAEKIPAAFHGHAPRLRIDLPSPTAWYRDIARCCSPGQARAGASGRRQAERKAIVQLRPQALLRPSLRKNSQQSAEMRSNTWRMSVSGSSPSALRLSSLDYVGLRGECWIPVPLPPPRIRHMIFLIFCFRRSANSSDNSATLEVSNNAEPRLLLR